MECRGILEKKGRLLADGIPDVPGGSSRAPGFLSPRLLFALFCFFPPPLKGRGWIVSTGSLHVQAQGAIKILAASANSLAP